MVITAYGFVLFLTAANATVLQAAYPPYGLANVSLVGLASFLILMGLYNSAISVVWEYKQQTRKTISNIMNTTTNIKCASCKIITIESDDAGYAAIHKYMGKQIPAPSDCPQCHRKLRLVLCNVSMTYDKKTYNRDPRKWYWACDKCHMNSDGRLSATVKRMSMLDKTGKKNPNYRHGKRCKALRAK